MMFTVVVPVFLAMGFSQSFFGGVVSYPSFYDLFPKVNTSTTKGDIKEHNSLIQGTVNACLNLGAVAGCLSCMYVGNKLGRRKTTVLGNIIAVVGTILHATAFSFAQLIVSRLILGYGIGMASSTVPAWQTETSRTHKRGHHVIADGITIGFGIALASWATFGFSHVTGTSSWQWRVPAITPGIMCVIAGFAATLFPESPRWLALTGDYAKSRDVLAVVYDEEIDSVHVAQVLENIQHANEEAAEGASFFSIFKMGKEKVLYRLLLACSVQWYSQMAGSGLITYYSNQLFANIGLDSQTSKIMAACVLTFKAACAFIPFATIELAGRRKLFLISGAGMAVCMFALAASASQVPKTVHAGYAGIVFAFLYVFFYPIGFLGVNWLFCQEIITTRYRAPVAGVSTAVHWLTSFAVSLTTPLGFTSLGWKYYLIWGASATSILFVVYFFYPETTDMSVEEIDQIFIDSTGVFATPRLATQRRKAAIARRANSTGVVEHFGSDHKVEIEEREVA
ncbi:uncharacterized protein IL334_004504 [Kwoniella shivajii]|uniref:Major facilitator superfamily (MFS) profile domain-containing protein n=1 Tax=Kwoniella shivajii TaxID=564305 RepID=A0ABZ1D1R8_9TREE|nr:hypothetical protein IL334_004504 [Kwoniella shivajii]